MEQKEKEPNIQQSCRSFLYLANINWSKLINILDMSLTALGAFSTELLQDSELSDNGEFLLNFFNPTLFVVMLNNDNNPTLTKAMDGPNSTGFVVAMEKKAQTLIQKQAFIVVDKEPWINVVSSV